MARKPAQKRQRPQAVGYALARPGDPLVLPDGTIVPEDVDRPPAPDYSAPTSIHGPEPEHFRPQQHRVLRDITVPPKILNAIAVVFAYTMLGISEIEICDVTGLDVDEIRRLRANRMYAELFDTVLNEFVSANSAILQSRIAAASHTALSRVVHLVDHGEIDAVRLTASRDLLNRAGARPEDLVRQKASQASELRIVVEEADSDRDIEEASPSSQDIFSGLGVDMEDID